MPVGDDASAPAKENPVLMPPRPDKHDASLCVRTTATDRMRTAAGGPEAVRNETSTDRDMIGRRLAINPGRVRYGAFFSPERISAVAKAQKRAPK